MKITLAVYGLPDQRALDLPLGATVAQAIRAAGLQKAAVGIIVLNGKIVQEHMPLKTHDELTLYPPLVGG